MNVRSKWSRSVGGAVVGVAAALLTVASPASAQVDVRMIRPDVMVLLDTSGSMEWRTSTLNATCIGGDGGPCNVCSNGASICSPSCPATESHNRWTTAMEVLTGTISNFTCVEQARNDPTVYTYDYLYPIPYHEPRSNGLPLWASGAVQLTDGILDTYRDTVRFGVMTFDNDIRTGLQATDGLFSYGTDRLFLANGCTDAPTPVNLGSRRASTDNNVTDVVPGALVSVGPSSADTVTLHAINDAVQQTLTGHPNTFPLLPVRGARPYGGTPVAAMLEDSYYYWTHNPDVVASTGIGGDPYYGCRSRYNILITDGQPNMDFRPACQGGGGQCPYQTPDQTAMQLAMSSGGNPGVKTFVIAFNASDTGAQLALTPIALAGGTASVFYASDRATLSSALSSVLDSIATQTSTRTAPAFGQASSGSGTNSTLYQFQSSFAVNSGYPWEGVLERRRTACQGAPPAPVDQNVVQNQDDFGYLLRASQRSAQGWGTRKLWTWIPPSTTTAAAMQLPMAWSAGLATRTNLDGSVPPAIVNEPSTTARDTLFAWLRGDASDPFRATRPLGDIFHSNPLVWNAPTSALPDQTFAAYQQLTLATSAWRSVAKTIGTRENVVYVGTNDGILHAFNADTGEEIWGFVPPFLTGQIQAMYPNTHQFGVDGSPVAREMVYFRSVAALGSATSWHSVLLVGLRGGGGAYEALDVTDPYNPAFLWQFSNPNLATAYGTPALGSVYTNWGGTVGERAIAILPGGQGTPVTTGTCTAALGARPSTATSDTRISIAAGPGTRRAAVNCWQGQTGQYLYVVDVQSGRLMATFGPTGSPLVGSPSLYIGTPGAVSTRAYVGDADGGMWRLDMSDPSPSRWRFGLAFDTFYDAPQMLGQPIVSAPVLSQDHNGDTLIALGTGDPDLLEGTDLNRIAVYREATTTDSFGAITGIRVSNVWEARQGANTTLGDLYAGERLTGALSLFNGNLYFGTFVPSSSSDVCQMGFSRLWGVSEATVAGGRPNPVLDLDGDPATTGDIVRVTQDINGNGTTADDANSVLYGVGVVRRPSCVNISTSTDPIAGTSHQFVDGIQGGDFRLVAQTGRGGTASGGSRTTVVSRTLPPPITQTQVNSWAVVFE